MRGAEKGSKGPLGPGGGVCVWGGRQAAVRGGQRGPRRLRARPPPGGGAGVPPCAQPAAGRAPAAHRGGVGLTRAAERQKRLVAARGVSSAARQLLRGGLRGCSPEAGRIGEAIN